MNIVIAGGQTKADFLIEMFKKEHHKIVVINDTVAYASYLAKKHKIEVIVNDPTNRLVLEEANIDKFDVMVALLPNDADNLAVCQLAKNVFHIKKTVASVSDPRNVEYFKILGVDTAISATFMISKYIEKASVLESIARSIVTEFDSLAITTVTVKEECVLAYQTLADINLPVGISIGAVMRKNQIIIPKGNTELHPEDKVLIISSNEHQQEAIDLFAKTK